MTDYPLRGTPFDAVDLFNRVPGMSALTAIHIQPVIRLATADDGEQQAVAAAVVAVGDADRRGRRVAQGDPPPDVSAPPAV